MIYVKDLGGCVGIDLGVECFVVFVKFLLFEFGEVVFGFDCD